MVNISGVSIPDALTYAETGNAGPHAIMRFLDDKDTPDPADDLDLQYSYDASQQRIVQVSKVAGSGSVRKKLSVGAFELESTATPASPHQHESWRTWTWNRQSARVLVSAPGAGLLGVVSFPMSSMQALTAPTRHAFVSDHLGSIVGVVTAAGSLVERSSYDAWGHARDPDTGVLLAAMPQRMADRGFTGHEELPNLDLVHMNGRIYDPLATRFLSPDPFVQFPEFDQSYNRYSYVLNNPLTFTDPSGYFIDVVIQAAFALVSVYQGTMIIVQAVEVYQKTGDLGAALKSYAISTAAAVVAYAVGQYFGPIAAKAATEGVMQAFAVEVSRAVVHGLTQGMLAELGGGSMGDAFLGAFSTLGTQMLFASTPMGNAFGLANGTGPTGELARLLIATMMGGTAAALGGGKFSNGAWSAAITWAFNHERPHEGNGKGSAPGQRKPGESERSIYYLLDAGAVRGNGHAAVVVEGGNGGVVYFSFGPGASPFTSSDNLEVIWYESIDLARADLARYDLALEFRISASGAANAIRTGLEWKDESYDALSLQGSNCATVADSIMRKSGADWSRPILPVGNVRPVNFYNKNISNADHEFAWRLVKE